MTPGPTGVLLLQGRTLALRSTLVALESREGAKPGILDDAELVLAQAELVFPGLSAVWNRRVTQSLPHKSRFFRASYAHYRVGQYTRFGGYERVRQGGVFFCGEHISLGFQGFMEGAASEGRRVAQQLTRLLTGRAPDAYDVA